MKIRYIHKHIKTQTKPENICVYVRCFEYEVEFFIYDNGVAFHFVVISE